MTFAESRLAAPSGSASGIELPLRLFLVFVLLRPGGPPLLRSSVFALAVAGLVSSRLLRTPLHWIALAAALTARLILEWPLPDNHVHLEAYFGAAIALSLAVPNGHETLARASRLLIGLAFASAVLWKGVLSPDYREGTFFRVTLLTDPRFEPSLRFVGGLEDAEIRENRQYLTAVPAEEAPGSFPYRLHEPEGLRRFAFVLTWGGLLLEAAVAVLFLLPGRSLGAARHTALLVFCASTYAVASVAPFGWLLLLMGLAGCRPDDRGGRAAYLAALALVLLYAERPWASAFGP